LKLQASGPVFKDDVNGFSFTSDICFKKLTLSLPALVQITKSGAFGNILQSGGGGGEPNQRKNLNREKFL
jgi:hypothetical protein